MNRIAGIFNFDQAPVDALEIARMVEALSFHGQGPQNIWFEGPVGLTVASNGDLYIADYDISAQTRASKARRCSWATGSPRPSLNGTISKVSM